MSRKRYSIGAEFLLYAEDADDAAMIVSNFVDSFPEQIDRECEGDVIVQGPAAEVSE